MKYPTNNRTRVTIGFVVALLATIVFIGADEAVNHQQRKIRDLTKHYDIICLGGVQYYSGSRSLAAVFDPNTGIPKRCPADVEVE